MPVDPKRVQAVFLAAAEESDPTTRAAVLDRNCGGDAELRHRVEALLKANDEPGSYLDQPAVAPVTGTIDYAPISEKPGTMIGPYKLKEQIGEGGFGLVFVAEQTEPVRRKVALKIIKPGMDTREVMARFTAERQALAMMDHPNIARVLDAGATDSGRPYFVMELVRGIPITEYCDQNQLPPRERLDLFITVCQAIQHAHQKGIIHRDVKPSNVLVTSHDGKPVAKVIDFGVAKAIHQQLTAHSVYTNFAQMIGTPLYMSPEQAEMSGLDIDTRTDIYSLGVLLYELLTGTTPLDKKRFVQGASDEIRRLIREEEPPKPSTRLSTSESIASIAAQRHMEPAKLSKLMRGDLDWITMKALEKDRTRRYETANGLARDIQRYLSDEPVEACPPSAGYRLRKLMRKHRGGLATAASFLSLLVVAAGVSIWLAVRARQAEVLAEKRREEADANAKEAKKNEDLYHKEATDNMTAMIAAEISAASLQTDLDLSELRTDPKVGLLRLAHPRQQEITRSVPGRKHIKVTREDMYGRPEPLPPSGSFDADDDRGSYEALREFSTFAALAAGQQFAPLLPPITHDGQPVGYVSLSPDKQTLLTLGQDHTARLWDARTGRPIAILRKDNEKVVNAEFSQDGKTAFTDDQTSVARLWEVPGGKFRVATEPRPNRYVLHENRLVDASYFQRIIAALIGSNRLLTQRVVEKASGFPGSTATPEREGPLELWDVATGRLVGKLEVPEGVQVFSAQFLGNWVIIRVKDGGTLLVFSAENGPLLGRIPLPMDENLEEIDVSPNGRQLATVHGDGQGGFLGSSENYVLRVWDVATGQVRSSTTMPGKLNIRRIRYWMDEAFGGGDSVVAVAGVNGWTVYRAGRDEPIAEFPGVTAVPDLLGRAAHLVHGGNGGIYDARTWQRLYPPPGRKFHPDLVKFAPDGRFVRAAINDDEVLIDTRTDKVLPFVADWLILPDSGLIGCTLSNSTASIRMLPPASRLNVPANLLELWAQVAVRGELDADGRFVKWDEAKWETKRLELAAKTAPDPDFPFPGHVAKDQLHWLRQEYDNANDAAKPDLASKLLARAEALGDKTEAVRWRAVPRPPEK
jgi:serine/threonine protein kinase/WD40 repeat protein